jgi:hypothetical protein
LAQSRHRGARPSEARCLLTRAPRAVRGRASANDSDSDHECRWRDVTVTNVYGDGRPVAVYVLHALQKKSQRTAKMDIELAKVRYRMIGGKS